jgi:hypothetical protein
MFCRKFLGYAFGYFVTSLRGCKLGWAVAGVGQLFEPGQSVPGRRTYEAKRAGSSFLNQWGFVLQAPRQAVDRARGLPVRLVQSRNRGEPDF